MTTLAARTIDALRREHDSLAGLVSNFTDQQLTGPSGASEWSIAQVLSHLGSGSQIGLAGLRASLEGSAPPDDAFNHSIWDRWNAMAPADQRDGFLEHNNALVEAFEALTPEQHESLEVRVGFLPMPLSVAGVGGMRLNEVAHHTWDVRVAGDPSAGLLDVSAAVLPEHMAGGLGFLLGFIGKADRVDGPVVLGLGDSGYRIVIDEQVAFGTEGDEPTATFDGPIEAVLRLIAGRLSPEHTPGGVAVSGNVTLEQLREVFPGY